MKYLKHNGTVCTHGQVHTGENPPQYFPNVPLRLFSDIGFQYFGKNVVPKIEHMTTRDIVLTLHNIRTCTFHQYKGNFWFFYWEGEGPQRDLQWPIIESVGTNWSQCNVCIFCVSVGPPWQPTYTPILPHRFLVSSWLPWCRPKCSGSKKQLWSTQGTPILNEQTYILGKHLRVHTSVYSNDGSNKCKWLCDGESTPKHALVA